MTPKAALQKLRDDAKKWARDPKLYPDRAGWWCTIEQLKALLVAIDTREP